MQTSWLSISIFCVCFPSLFIDGGHAKTLRFQNIPGTIPHIPTPQIFGHTVRETASPSHPLSRSKNVARLLDLQQVLCELTLGLVWS